MPDSVIRQGVSNDDPGSLLRRNSGRLLRERWSSPSALAEELYTILGDEVGHAAEAAVTPPQVAARASVAQVVLPTASTPPAAQVVTQAAVVKAVTAEQAREVSQSVPGPMPERRPAQPAPSSTRRPRTP